MKWVLFPHSGCVNHGCEALARTIITMVADVDPAAKTFLYSTNMESDLQYGLDKITTVVPIQTVSYQTSRLMGLYYRGMAKIKHRDVDDYYIAKSHQVYKNCDIALSIGGDNYCYTGMQHVLSEHMRAIKKMNKKSVLIGCSLDEKLLTPHVIEELKLYDSIVVRESVSKQILYDIGITKNVYLASDPAFLLNTQPTEWSDQRMNEHKVVGVNISPLIMRYGETGVIYENYRRLLIEILKDKDAMVVLIPHVEQHGNDDYLAAQELIQGMDCSRITIIPNGYNCMQLKSLISKCDCFIGCRTHATIAAYSSCVPTLVVGYSNKSIGIARDLFGDDDGLVVPVQNFISEDSLRQHYIAFLERKENLRLFLNNNIVGYSNKAKIAIEVLKNMSD